VETPVPATSKVPVPVRDTLPLPLLIATLETALDAELSVTGPERFVTARLVATIPPVAWLTPPAASRETV